MNNDPLANALSSILNYERVSKKEIVITPISRILTQVLDILNRHGYIGGHEKLTDARGGFVKIHLLGSINKCGVIKPRFSATLEEFDKFEKRYLPAQGVGLIIISTPQGLMTMKEARQKHVGGRLIAYCY